MFKRTWGSGDQLVVALHGWTGDHRHFEPLSQHLPAGSRLVAFDLPGFGASDAPPAWDMESVGRHIAPEIDALPGDELTLLTNCSGAYAALKAVPHLRRAPSRLVLVDAFGYAPKYFKIFTNPRWGHHAYRTTFANPVGRGITNAVLARKKRSEGGITDTFREVNHENTLAWLRSCVALGDCRQFANVQLPTTLAFGENTFSAVRKSLPMWREIWPHVRELELKGAGHLGVVEAAVQLASVVFTRSEVQAAAQT